MKKPACLLALFYLAVLVPGGAGAEENPATAPAGPVQFNRDVLPILSEHCFKCHGPDERQRETKQRFDTRAGVERAVRKGFLVPGKPAESELIERLLSDDDEEVMPPPGEKRRPSPAEVAILRRWIEQGAKWQDHWAFVVPTRSKPPEGGSLDKLDHPVDRFIAHKLQQGGVQPGPRADRAVLLRRISLDLIGLPPSPQERERFLSDEKPGAWERLVDRLLASPQYGERMALYWLDLVRYADSVGYQKDSHQNIWLYRDYVIAAFNNNKPFDSFVREQLAGDLLKDPNGSAAQVAEWRIASGFNRLNQTTSEGGAQAKEYMAKYAADRVRNTGAIFLGMTTGCAECHDHKYDPITSRDFYNFAAFFADLKERGVAQPREVKLPTMEYILRVLPIEQELRELKELLTGKDVKDAGEVGGRVAALEKQLEELTRSPPMASTIVTEPGKPRLMRFLSRGNWLDDSGPEAVPAIPAYFGKLEVGNRRANRLDLAEWMVARDNPLTARVFVNRLWKLLFGRGISSTLDDAGARSSWPTHLPLLDWLAVEFIESGWDVKRMAKLIVMSEAYRRRSVPFRAEVGADPQNRLLGWQNSFRLEAEQIRDQALAAAGLLSGKMYGRSVKPYQPANYWFKLYHQAKYQQDKGAGLYRRGVYTYWRRSFWHPSLRAFDAPSREECVAERPRSNTPQQALVLLNDPIYVEAARVFAQGLMAEGGGTSPERINWAYRRLLCRDAQGWEVDTLLKLYEKHLAGFRENKDAAAKLAAVGEYPVARELSSVEVAAWMSVTRAVLNLHETITRN